LIVCECFGVQEQSQKHSVILFTLSDTAIVHVVDTCKGYIRLLWTSTHRLIQMHPCFHDVSLKKRRQIIEAFELTNSYFPSLREVTRN